MKSKYPHNIVLRMGDWSDDGHGKTTSVSIKSNRSLKQIEKAYKEGVKIVGFDLVLEVAREWTDHYIDHDLVQKLINHGYNWEIDEREERYSIYDQDYFPMYMFIASLGDTELKWKKVDSKNSIIDIGGYGLFD